MYTNINNCIMAFTRIHDDYCRIAKEVQESTGAGRYRLKCEHRHRNSNKTGTVNRLGNSGENEELPLTLFWGNPNQTHASLLHVVASMLLSGDHAT